MVLLEHVLSSLLCFYVQLEAFECALNQNINVWKGVYHQLTNDDDDDDDS